MQHFLPKRTSSSAASSCPKPASTQQPAKPTPATSEPRTPKDRQNREHSCSVRRYPFPKRQGPWPKIALDPMHQKSSWSAGRKMRGQSLVAAGPSRKQSLMCLLSPRSAMGAKKMCYVFPTGPRQGVRALGHNKTHTFWKESKCLLLPTISTLPLCSQSLELFKPLSTRAEAWKAIPGVSEWVMAMIRRGYTLQFARRPPRCAHHHSVQQVRSSPPHRGDESAGPLTNMPRGLVHVTGSERRLLSYPGSPHHRRFLRFAFEGVAQTNLRSPKAMHMPGKINQGANMLSRNNIYSEE